MKYLDKEMIAKFVRRFQISVLLIYCGLNWMFTDNSSQVIRTIGKHLPDSKPLRVILLWSKNCEFPKSDRNLVNWASQDFDGEIVVIINCDCLEHLIEKLPEDFLVHTVLIRKNIGYDWGGYRDLLLNIETSHRPFVTFLNNSVIPLFPFSTFLKEQEDLAQEINGIAGAIESASPTKHIQSFCFTFSNSALNSAVADWLKNTKNVSQKWAMVYFREIRLQKVSGQKKIECQSLLSDRRIRSFAQRNFDLLEEHKDHAIYARIWENLFYGRLNPSHHLWRFLLELGFPFIKKELVLTNPAKLPDLTKANLLIERASNA
jgi:hypothetical protein